MTQRYFTMFFKSKFKNNLEDLVEGPDHLKSLKVCFNASSFQFFQPKCAMHYVGSTVLFVCFCNVTPPPPAPIPCNVTHVTKHSLLHFDIINLLLQCPYCNLVRIDKSG